VEIFVYEGAGHAFNRDVDPASYAPDAAKLARERTLKFLKAHIA
jgi:carboxymethylenebutenolidase